jgi:hypothetical protein
VIADPHARYFGVELEERTLVPGHDAQLAKTRFEAWLGPSVLGKGGNQDGALRFDSRVSRLAAGRLGYASTGSASERTTCAAPP